MARAYDSDSSVDNSSQASDNIANFHDNAASTPPTSAVKSKANKTQQRVLLSHFTGHSDDDSLQLSSAIPDPDASISYNCRGNTNTEYDKTPPSSLHGTLRSSTSTAASEYKGYSTAHSGARQPVLASETAPWNARQRLRRPSPEVVIHLDRNGRSMSILGKSNGGSNGVSDGVRKQTVQQRGNGLVEDSSVMSVEDDLSDLSDMQADEQATANEHKIDIKRVADAILVKAGQIASAKAAAAASTSSNGKGKSKGRARGVKAKAESDIEAKETLDKIRKHFLDKRGEGSATKSKSKSASKSTSASSSTRKAGDEPKRLTSKQKGKGKARQVSEDEEEDELKSDDMTDDDDDDMPIKRKRAIKPSNGYSHKKLRIVRESSGEESEFSLGQEMENDGEGDPESALSDVSSDEDNPQSGTPAAAVRAATARSRRNRIKSVKLTWWEKNEEALRLHHPELRTVWQDLKELAVIKPVKADQPDGLTLKLLPFQQEGLYWMLEQEKGPWRGGMLADEMGMGKTIQTISLILSDHDPNVKKHTLILAPVVAIMQWRNEFNKFTSGMKVCVWHGGNRSNDAQELLKFDVVLTSYSVLENTFRKQNTGFKRKGELIKEDSVLHSIMWHRVILDEAHNIKDRSCNTARGAFALKSDFRWCLSGTPLQNRVGELYSLIRFLGADPFAHYYCKKCPCKSLHWRFSNKRTCDECGHTPMHHICYWNNEILKPIQKYGATIEGHGKGAFEKLSLLLARMMLRRTKVERADDMGLPPRDVVVRRDFFTEEEEEFYSSLYSDVKRTFSTYVAADSLLNNYANIFQLLTRMRQTACHPDMVLKGRSAQALLGNPAEPTSISTCRICLDESEEPVMSKCRHVFCRECIRQYLETSLEVEPECPVCHLPISIDLTQEANEEITQARQGMLEKIDPGKWRTSTKIEALVEELSKLRTEDSSIKSLVFSQFTSFLDLIARRLQLAGFKIARLQGSMSPEARDRTVKYFMNTTDCTVFLLSLKAGGVALNLTEASRVFLTDVWWNPAAEVQAMDRIHRIGQHRPIIVKRLIIENSIEAKIVELQKKKESMVGAALGDDDQALGRLTPEDLSFLFTM